MPPKKVRKRNGDRSARVEPRRRECICEWCGVVFLAARYHAVTCSDLHRLKWSRWARRYHKHWGHKPGFGPRGKVEHEDVRRAR